MNVNQQNNMLQDRIWDMLNELSAAEKNHVFEKYMTNLSEKWRADYE